MKYEINCIVNKQQFSFENDMGYIFNYTDNIILKIQFSPEWKGLFKFIGISSDEKDYEYELLSNGEEIIFPIPVKFLRYPGVAIHFYGKEKNEETYEYRLPTNFQKIRIKGGI